jgi:hypothetical protein
MEACCPRAITLRRSKWRIKSSTCYVEPTSVGSELIPMPLFFDPEHYINVPLEATYLGAYEGVPRRWKRVIEGTV